MLMIKWSMLLFQIKSCSIQRDSLVLHSSSCLATNLVLQSCTLFTRGFSGEDIPLMSLPWLFIHSHFFIKHLLTTIIHLTSTIGSHQGTEREMSKRYSCPQWSQSPDVGDWHTEKEPLFRVISKIIAYTSSSIFLLELETHVNPLLMGTLNLL